jgi:hypothetical protein
VRAANAVADDANAQLTAAAVRADFRFIAGLQLCTEAARHL